MSEIKPPKSVLLSILYILQDWQRLNDCCPLHQDNDADPEECNCAEQANVICMIDWIKQQLR